MINGLIGQWIDEAGQHLQHALAAATYIKEAISISTLIQAAIVAAVAAVIASQIIIARLEERIVTIKELQNHLLNDHVQFAKELSELRAQNSRVEARQQDVMKRLDRDEGVKRK